MLYVPETAGITTAEGSPPAVSLATKLLLESKMKTSNSPAEFAKLIETLICLVVASPGATLTVNANVSHCSAGIVALHVGEPLTESVKLGISKGPAV